MPLKIIVIIKGLRTLVILKWLIVLLSYIRVAIYG
jgi:hypothetical protein